MAGMPRASSREHILGRDLRQWRTALGRWLVRAFRVALALLGRGPSPWGLRRTVAAIGVVGAGLTLAITEAATDVYEDVAAHTGIAGLDEPVLAHVVAARTPGTARWVTAFTDLGGPIGGTVLALTVLALLTWAWRGWTPALVMVPALAGALLVTSVGKELTGRARPPRELAVPPIEVSASFPSGHTLNATVLAGLTAYLLLIVARRVWHAVAGVVLAAGYAVAMGVSRVWLGHHWLSDVIAGWLLGAAWVVGVVTLHRLVLTMRSR